MGISQRLDIRQTQALVMTPQLQQAIKLLQMSNQELGDFISEEVEKNPLLERADDSAEGDRIDLGQGEAPIASAPEGDKDGAELSSEEINIGSTAEVADEGGAASDDYGGGDSFSSSGRNSFNDDDLSSAQNVAAGPSLREHLLGQIHVDFIDPAELLIATALVELLDEAGYLPADLSSIRLQLGASAEQLEKVVNKLQCMDPPGIFARSLPECLAAQLREKDRLDPAMQILLKHLDLLAKHEHSALTKLCMVDAEDMDQMISEIRKLNPKPASPFFSDVAQPITPDVMLRPQAGGGWHIELNTENLPRVLANERYYAKIQNGTRSKADKEYLSERWRQANWLIKALHQRANTILKVAAEIVKQQDKFFLHGIQHLKPLILRDIAAAVEMHESTVSRVTQNKYIATPRGLFELKYFFSNAIATTGGNETVAAVAVRDRIKSLIDAEAIDNILSDDKIADLLRYEGIDLARRTVAKYREALRIPSSSQRRREKRSRK
ncbi:MAG: RNA polymerase factor sigma-54 [Alphaproteobacteria bacterium]|nr:RNA polymerase factor sigma-54 [Alphaproteobacteria bacterium]